jgi:Phospholipase_D-nuclease N-terminal/Short C-terminal domain
MVLAYDYPLLAVFWSMFAFVIWFIWLMLLFRIISDVFRSRDLGGVAKAAWLIFVILLPFLGVIVYLTVRGDDMARNAIADAEARNAVFQTYVQEAAGTSGPGDQLTALAALRDAGQISDADFEAGKAKILS